ncbi:MAG: hypothetical protein B6D46_00155 [Polyangiaceae bacterium UTPRO1]|nr:MAG: hypothetical protein B6D46_00155 [Polyangiaceae bacterium UTPRO1]
MVSERHPSRAAQEAFLVRPLRRSTLPLSSLVVLTVLTGTSWAAPSPSLDDYVLFALDRMQVRNLRGGEGDLGVNAGSFVARGTLAAPAAQVVAGSADVAAASTCSGIYATSVGASGPTCQAAGAAPQPIVADVPAACGYPVAFPACNGAARMTVRAGRTVLPPGVYGDVVVKSSGAPATLELAGGSYVFCSLRVGRHGEVRFRAASQVHIADALKLGVGAVLVPADGMAAARAGRVYVRGKSVTIDRQARLAAVLCAPTARLKVNQSRIEGAAVAKEIRATGASVLRPYEEPRAACAARNPLRNLYFGDLHVHTALSFDAQAFDVRTTPAEAYGFARGAPVALPPLDVNGVGTRTVQLERPLDFAAVTDHSEFLGEVEECTTPGSPNYDAPTCQLYRGETYSAVRFFGLALTAQQPKRYADVCAPNGQECAVRGAQVWQSVQQAAEQAYDRSSACSFTTFVGYEYTSARATSTMHRNVIFRNDRVPYPTTYFEEESPRGLWSQLEAGCRDATSGCDVLAIPHNPNESNGHMFAIEYPGARSVAAERGQAAARVAMEPLVEIYQHKGDSECMNGLSGVIGASDEQCDFEKDPRPFRDCGDGTGGGGVTRGGCFSRLDFVRNVLLAGLAEEQRLGVNPYRLGIIAGTDTHNGTTGAVDETTFQGHRGTDDDTPASQLGNGVLTGGGIQFSPGGIVGVWAEENSRPSIFDALRRREVFGTSGPRMAVRFFGGWDLPAGLCTAPEMIADAYAAGVPMGSLLDPPTAAAPSFLIAATRDPGTQARPGTPLQRLQVVKGWIDDAGWHQEVFDVAGDGDNGATVDTDTCVASGPGDDDLCTVWTDPTFDASRRAFYYVRVLENPTCRWSTVTCNALPPDDRPPSCTDPTVPKTVQERAWSSPIWYRPSA